MGDKGRSGSGVVYLSRFVDHSGVPGLGGDSGTLQTSISKFKGTAPVLTFPEPAEKGKGWGKNVHLFPGGHWKGHPWPTSH